eukprot:CAMPEP_0174833856 /NCGR_PEP_ID=MMETSP1114-20130205/4489_1 /TAXON_ID=312471 /ORGANISM="Neobodo designis, Strain CCAP 1951/1" /LENGTH=1468 /DNA_ID=CAMNT_0016067755 /DNA_START=228 /DNA_END=4634 /DNA_ORIENTATION=+
MVAGAANAWDSDSQDDGPPNAAKDIFAQIKGVDIDYKMWVALTVAEREAVFDYLNIEDADRVTLEREVCLDKGKPAGDRPAVLTRIRKVLATMTSAAKATSKVIGGSTSQGSVYGPSAGSGSAYTSGGVSVSRSAGAVVPVGSVTDHTPPVVRSRLAHKFTGLVNQSSTCYLNALLQSLFHLPAFRKAIYHLRVDPGTEASASIPLALQQLFWSLEQKQRTRTVNLTKAFGWDSAEAAVQHDTHELVRKLFDVLEHQFNEQHQLQLQEASEEDAAAAAAQEWTNPIKRLFCGERLYYTKCLDVDYTSTRVEELYDLELVVKDNASIEDSLKAETTAERLDGSNKYCWEHDDEPKDPETGKVRKTYHDADRGVAYKRLPPVLMIHPNRLDFCMRTFQRITVDSKWVFGTELDMEPYIESADNAPANHVVRAQAEKEKQQNDGAATTKGDGGDEDGGAPPTKQATEEPTADDGDSAAPAKPAGQDNTAESRKHVYRLRSVVTHSGAATFGHYYCYVNFDDGAWVKFNDETVTDVHVSDVWRDAYGGSSVNQWGYTSSSNTRAGLLIYVREDAIDECLTELTEADAPEHLTAFAQAEAARQEAERQRKEAEARLATVPTVLFDEAGDFVAHLRDLRKAPVRKLDPDVAVGDADPELRDCTLWRVSNYFGFSHNGYRLQTQSAQLLNPADTVGVHWPRNTMYQTHVLLAVPHALAAPPAEGETPRLITAFKDDPVSGLVFDGVFTTVAALKRAFPNVFAAAAATTAADGSPDLDGPTVVDTPALSGVDAPSPVVGDEDDDVFIPDTRVANGADGDEWAGVALATGGGGARNDGSETGDSVVAAGSNGSDRGLTPAADMGGAVGVDEEGSDAVGNPLNNIYADQPNSKLDSQPAASAATTAQPTTSTAAPAPVVPPATTTTAATAAASSSAVKKPSAAASEPRVYVEAGMRLQSHKAADLVSGDIVVVPYGTEDAALKHALRAFALQHSSCDITLFRLPGTYDSDRVEDADSMSPAGASPAVTPVTGGGTSPDNGGGTRFPAMDDAVEVGQLRVVETDTYDELQDAVAEYLNDPTINPRCIAFRSHSASADAPHKNLAERATKTSYYDPTPRVRTVKDVLCGPAGTYMICKLYFEVLPMTVEEFESQGLRDYIAIDGGSKRHFWGPKTTSYLYAADTKKLRSEACRKLGVPVGRVALFTNDYYGSMADVTAAPLEADPADTVADAPPVVADNKKAGDEDDADGPPPLTNDAGETVAPAPAEAKRPEPRRDIMVPYTAPSYCTLDQSHLVILPDLPPPTTGCIPPPPAEQSPGVTTVEVANPDEPRPLRWMLVGVQHATRRSRDDIFGFGCCVYVCESDTAATIRERILTYLGASDEAAEKWTLLFMKANTSSPMFIGKDTRAIDILPFEPPRYTSAYPVRFTGSFVLERPMPAGAKKAGGKRGAKGGGHGTPEPELRIHATGAALAGAGDAKK